MFYPEDERRLRDGIPEPTPEEQAYQSTKNSAITQLEGLDTATLQKRLKGYNKQLQRLQNTPSADKIALQTSKGFRDAAAQCLLLKSEPNRPIVAGKQGGLSLPFISALIRRIRR